MVWTSRSQRRSRGAGEAGGDASETRKEEVMSLHKETNRRPLGQPDLQPRPDAQARAMATLLTTTSASTPPRLRALGPSLVGPGPGLAGQRLPVGFIIFSEIRFVLRCPLDLGFYKNINKMFTARIVNCLFVVCFRTPYIEFSPACLSPTRGGETESLSPRGLATLQEVACCCASCPSVSQSNRLVFMRQGHRLDRRPGGFALFTCVSPGYTVQSPGLAFKPPMPRPHLK